MNVTVLRDMFARLLLMKNKIIDTENEIGAFCKEILKVLAELYNLVDSSF